MAADDRFELLMVVDTQLITNAGKCRRVQSSDAKTASHGLSRYKSCERLSLI
jgi:hypothetical protein